MDQRHVVMVAEHGDDLLRLAQPQQAVIDEDAGQLVPDRLMDQNRRHRGVDAARQAADHLLVAHLFADLADRLFAIGAHRPVAFETGQFHEILIEFRALGGVMHLRMELHGKETARGIGGDGEGGVGGGAIDLEPRRDGRDVVAVAHPDLFAPVGEPAVEDGKPRIGGRDKGAAEFGSAVAAFDLAAEAMHHHLLAIADAEDRDAHVEDARRRHRRAFGKDRSRTAGEDHGLGGKGAEEGVVHLVERVDLAIDVQLAQAARDQLRHLAAEVDDEEAVMRALGHAPA